MGNGKAIPGGLVGTLLGLLLGAPSTALAAEDLPQTTDELWERLPSYDVKPGDQPRYQTKFCRRFLKDLKNHPEKFERIPPKVETDSFDDPRLQELLPGCSRKKLTFSQPKDPDGGRIVEGLYADEGFALWPLSYIDESYPSDVVMVWLGPSYFFKEDMNQYLPPDKRNKLEKVYDRYGEIMGVKGEGCKIIPKFSVGTLSSFEKGMAKIRNMFFVSYMGNEFVMDVSVKRKGSFSVRSQVLDKSIGNRINFFNEKSCFFPSD